MKPELHIEQPDGVEGATSLGMSGWLTGTDGAFSLPYRPDFKFGVGNYTVVQTFDATASGATRVATYDDYNASTGLRFSQVSGTFSVDSGDITVNLPTNPLDGTNRWLLVERESNVAVRAYLDDFSTAVATGSDNGTDISNTENLYLAYDGTTYMDGLLGLTIVFDRLLEDYEKDDLYYWIQTDYSTDVEPEWLRAAAVLYVNPNDPVQQAEYAARDRIINLAVAPPSEIYVRYTFTSDDGISNPVLSYNDVRFSNARMYENGYDYGAIPVLRYGHGHSPMSVKISGDPPDHYIVVPLETLGTTWINGDWSVNFWIKSEEVAAAEYVLGQGPFSDTGGWGLRYTTADELRLDIGSTEVMRVAADSTETKYTMVTVRRSGNNFEVFFDGVSQGTAVSSATVTLTHDFTYGGESAATNLNGLLGPLHIWTEALTDNQIQALYATSPESSGSVSNSNVTITGSFSTQNLNWERV